METWDITELERDCVACPSAWMAETRQGDTLYIRYRWGELTVSVVQEDSKRNEIYNDQIGDELDGVLDEREMKSELSSTGKFSFS